jgi:hypothetical protein
MNKNQTYLVRVEETVAYELKVEASSSAEARKKILEINNGNATLSDFSDGEATPLHYGKVVVKSVESIP